MYAAQINDDRIRQGKFLEDQLQQVSARQNYVLQSFLGSKEKIVDHTGKITRMIVDKLFKQLSNSTSEKDSVKRLNSPDDDVKFLPPNN